MGHRYKLHCFETGDYTSNSYHGCAKLLHFGLELYKRIRQYMYNNYKLHKGIGRQIPAVVYKKVSERSILLNTKKVCSDS